MPAAKPVALPSYYPVSQRIELFAKPFYPSAREELKLLTEIFAEFPSIQANKRPTALKLIVTLVINDKNACDNYLSIFVI